MSEHEKRADMFNVRTGEAQVIELAEAHIEKYVGNIETVMHEIESDDLHIDVHVVLATEEQPFVTLITTGMSDLPMAVEDPELQYAELFFCLPPDWPISLEAFNDEANYWPIRWLKMLARYPHQAGTWLGQGHTIPNGNPPEPLGDFTDMSGILLMPPLFLPDEFATLYVSDEKVINFYQLLPLYREEMELKVEKGADVLFEKFQENIPADLLLYPERPNVC
jgi:Suppressor of fused protein (SUFU).